MFCVDEYEQLWVVVVFKGRVGVEYCQEVDCWCVFGVGLDFCCVVGFGEYGEVENVLVEVLYCWQVGDVEDDFGEFEKRGWCVYRIMLL